jgi:energy-coupling factor transport system substrate-specific component
VSWTAAAFAILAAALAAGYAWYERAQPTARLAAMVATMAGLAALGRIAFAPLPDVKPTTDIIVLSGFVLGAAPGFAIGATGALASNVVFGQGPWTPWQMAAWGLTGLLGAALGAATGRDAGRIGLALFCGAMGLLFGAIMDFSTLASYAGEHSLDRYLAISGTALPFNVAPAVGNVAFCLAFGPALVRALERFRARLHITWIPLEVTRS